MQIEFSGIRQGRVYVTFWRYYPEVGTKLMTAQGRTFTIIDSIQPMKALGIKGDNYVAILDGDTVPEQGSHLYPLWTEITEDVAGKEVICLSNLHPGSTCVKYLDQTLGIRSWPIGRGGETFKPNFVTPLIVENTVVDEALIARLKGALRKEAPEATILHRFNTSDGFFFCAYAKE